MHRAICIIGNWKMHKTVSEAEDFIERLVPRVKDTKTCVCLAVPFTAIAACAAAAEGSLISIGAQNICGHPKGAYTGEISASMIREAGATFVLIGHSERRKIFHESDEMIRLKVLRALDEKITPVLCIGETQEERDNSATKKVLESQLSSALNGLSKEALKKVKLAYEPVWAIGTGKTATPEIAQETHHLCREFLKEHWGEEIAHDLPILYGGSVKPENTKALLEKNDIDGALVGGASLDVLGFSQIINFRK